MIYAFILGKNTALSVAEIVSVLQAHKLDFSLLSLTEHALIINAKNTLPESQLLLNILGGTIKIAEITNQTPEKLNSTHFLPLIQSWMNQGQKIEFAISYYGLKTVNSFKANQMGLALKKELKKSIPHTVRFIASKEGPALSSATTFHHHLAESKTELVAIYDPQSQETYLGYVAAVQNIESYNNRDYNRPSPDPHSGMLPPKLAQTMVNLAGLPTPLISKGKPATILDPFCGSGTVLQEALLLQHNILGSDISAKAVQKTISNLNWLITTYQLDPKPVESLITVASAENLTATYASQQVSAIVTEPYLGPAQSSIPSTSEAHKIIDSLVPLYRAFLTEIKELKLQDLTSVIVFPKIAGISLLDKMLAHISELGYNLICPIPESWQGQTFVNLNQKSFLYSRKDQAVEREIAILKQGA